MSMPPTKTAHLTPIPAPNASNCSAICKASSRVGESTRAKFACGVSRSSWKSQTGYQSTSLRYSRESSWSRRQKVYCPSYSAAWCKSMLRTLHFTLTCRIGIAKAPVFPDPVWARPITSLPAAAKQVFVECCSKTILNHTLKIQSVPPTCQKMWNCLLLDASRYFPS